MISVMMLISTCLNTHQVPASLANLLAACTVPIPTAAVVLAASGEANPCSSCRCGVAGSGNCKCANCSGANCKCGCAGAKAEAQMADCKCANCSGANCTCGCAGKMSDNRQASAGGGCPCGNACACGADCRCSGRHVAVQ